MILKKFSREEVANYIPKDKERAVLISISSPNGEPTADYSIMKERYVDILELKFDDIEEDWEDCSKNPDGCNVKHNFVKFDDYMAFQIFSFLAQRNCIVGNWIAPSINEIVVNCSAGISRSAGVVVALNEIINEVIETEIPKEYERYNRTVYRRIITVSKSLKNTNRIVTAMHYLQAVTLHFKKPDYFMQHAIHTYNILKATFGVREDTGMFVAGLLHDVLEDTPVTYNEIKYLFGESVALLVKEVTKTKYNVFPNLTSMRGVILKFADRLSNLFNSYVSPEKDKEWKEKYIKKSKFWKSE